MSKDDDTSPKGSTPVPDPTILTTQQLTIGLAALREIIETRLNAMDTATDINKAATDKIPALICDKVSSLEKFHNEKFASIGNQFKERDIRAEREARDNKVAVDAAFAAQKEAAAKQDEANAKAIEKSERATAETIKTNQELGLSKIDSLTNQIFDLKGRLDRGEGGAVQKVESRGQNNWILSTLLACLAILVSLGTLITLALRH